MSSCSNDKPTKPLANPTYIYKLVPNTFPIPLDLTALPDALPISSIDQSSGFIHLSTSLQIPGTLTHFFTSESQVYILRLLYAPLEEQGQIKWEDPELNVCGPRPSEGTFPHLYNGLRLGRGEVESMRMLEKGSAGWEEAIERDEAFKTWLVY